MYKCYVFLFFTNSYTFTTISQDRGSPPMSTPITLMVNVVDALEGAPIFTQEVYSVSIAEENYTSVSTWLLTLKFKHLFPQSSSSMEFRSVS